MYGFLFKEPFSTKNFETSVLLRPGIGKRILLIHGIACTKEVWFLYPMEYPLHYFIAYDQRGFGEGHALDGDYSFEKYVSDALAVVKHYNPDLIIGHSFGGVVAQALAYHTRKPTIILESTARPPKSLESYSVRYIRAQMWQAIWDSLLSYIFSPGMLLLAINLMRYNPAMPAMDHLNEVLNFEDFCNKDKSSGIMKVIGGKRDNLSPPPEVEYLAKCSGKNAEIYNVNHLGILYPSFVRDTLSS